jgi:two-component system response regulator YesN
VIRLLIVDDEPYTVDGLYEMLSEIPQLELDLYRAYSAEEAMQRLTRNMMDIVLSDIRMPGMNAWNCRIGFMHVGLAVRCFF